MQLSRMRFVIVIYTLLLVLLLGGCSSPDEDSSRFQLFSKIDAPVQKVSSLAIGVFGTASPVQTLSRHPPGHAAHRILIGRAIVTTPRFPKGAAGQSVTNHDGSPTTYALSIGQTWDGVEKALQIRSAYSDGKQLAWQPAERDARMCEEGHWTQSCMAFALGFIFLDQNAFHRAARDGLSATLLGASTQFLIEAPPSLFQTALSGQSTTTQRLN